VPPNRTVTKGSGFKQFRMPAEWEPHEATWLAWPHEKTDWPGKFEPIPWLYGEIVRHLARVERVRIIVDDVDAEQRARRILKKCHADLNAVDFFRAPTNRSWTRDSLSPFVEIVQRVKAISHWHFNGWAKYDNFEHDAKLPGGVAKALKIPLLETGLVLEGGSIDVNGAGKLLTTEECLLSKIQERNLGFTGRDYERAFKKHLGVTETIWLGRGIAGDDTHGHVDDLARFTDVSTVVTVIEQDKSDANHEPLKENLARLRARGDLKIVTLPMPEPVYFNNQLLPASYANFYIANALVLVPTFADPKDRIALNTAAKLFPDREVIGIPCRDLVLGLGTLHCMTQQQPL
jgi:agmatine deiminase